MWMESISCKTATKKHTLFHHKMALLFLIELLSIHSFSLETEKQFSLPNPGFLVDVYGTCHGHK